MKNNYSLMYLWLRKNYTTGATGLRDTVIFIDRLLDSPKWTLTLEKELTELKSEITK